ncbi:Uncharacterized protein Adt_02069 [Abeliophyllum distichum]|uniref:Transposase (putative) gypsy type domain-containing protein n=1 Tax=Abeliophyllum distichum TaxID=126358 RepID=A0ABD1VUQ9_9LAMI
MSGNIGGDDTRFGGGEASPPVSPSMEGVLPIRGVDGSTGEAIPIASTPGLRETEDPYRANVVRWAAMDVPSIMVEEDLTKLREAYRIPADIELILPDPNERACFPRRGCTALHLNAFVSGMRLPLHPMLRRILRAYDLAPTQVAPNEWSQMVGGHVPMVSTLPWHGDASSRVSNHISVEEVAEEEGRRGGESWFWVSGNWQRVFDDPEPDLDVPSVYGIASGSEEPELWIDPEQTPVLGRAWTDGFQSPLFKGRWLLIRLEKVVLEGPSRPTLNPGSGDGGPFDSKRRLRELIGAPDVRIPDDVLRNVPFYPSMGAQDVKKYFTPKWEEFSSHGELEDVLEASLASAIRASAMQMKVLGEFRTRMQEQRKLVAQVSRADKEHEQALEGLKAALESARTCL